MPEPTPRDTASPGERDHAHDLRLRIRDLLRDTRNAKQMTQAALGEIVGVSRFTIMRYERGELAVPVRVAERLDKALDLTEFAALVRKLDGLAAGATEDERDLVLQRLLHDTPALESVTIALADDLDVFELFYDVGQNRPRLDARDVRVIVPSVERERQLFGDHLPLYGHIQRQIKRLADLQASEFRPFATLQIYESDDILASCVLANTRTGTECAVWSALPIGGVLDGRTLPIASSADTATTGQVEKYVRHLTAGRDTIRTNEALCRVDAGEAPQFTRYFSLGTDEEEDVAEDEGFAVALVLVIALCPRQHHGLARRVVTYKRPSARQDRERLSLFSNNVDDADVRAARAIEAGRPLQAIRSTRGALAAALDINDYLTTKGGAIPDLAFQLAAAREFSMFGLRVDPERLRPVALPPALQLIDKPDTVGRRRASVAPRLFTFELDPHEEQPELDLLEASADIEVVGIDDLTESEHLNSFLWKARDSGSLVPLLKEMGVAQR